MTWDSREDQLWDTSYLSWGYEPTLSYPCSTICPIAFLDCKAEQFWQFSALACLLGDIFTTSNHRDSWECCCWRTQVMSQHIMGKQCAVGDAGLTPGEALVSLSGSNCAIRGRCGKYPRCQPWAKKVLFEQSDLWFCSGMSRNRWGARSCQFTAVIRQETKCQHGETLRNSGKNWTLS